MNFNFSDMLVANYSHILKMKVWKEYSCLQMNGEAILCTPTLCTEQVQNPQSRLHTHVSELKIGSGPNHNIFSPFLVMSDSNRLI